jgi:hypothetical protein
MLYFQEIVFIRSGQECSAKKPLYDNIPLLNLHFKKKDLMQKKEGELGAEQLKIPKDMLVKYVDMRKKKFQMIVIILFLFLKEGKIQ